MNPSGQIPERLTRPRVGRNLCATMFAGRRLPGATLVAFLALLPASPAVPQTISADCKFAAATGTCPGAPGYPTSPTEETGANLYRLDRPEPSKYAQNAILEYYNEKGTLPTTFDQKVEAIALYVSKHMSWRDDAQNQKVFEANGFPSYHPGPGSDFPQPADLTLRISGTVNKGVPNDDFQGDCEDFAILRAALLRSQSICLPPSAIWNVLDLNVTHEYNVVVYKGAFRIMDYGTIDRWLPKHTWDSHQRNYGWNQDNGPRGWFPANNINNKFLKDNTNNCPQILGKLPSLPWGYLNYYQDKCPCP